jgi:hypothetical protein
LREEHGLWVFENSVLRRIFGPKRDEVTGGWRELHNEELNDLYCSPTVVVVIKSRIMRWAGYVACMGGEEECAGVLWRNLRERDHWGDPGIDGKIIRIIMDVQEVGYENMDWIELAQYRDRWLTLVNTVMNLRVP